jgi:hypothetical protein
MLWTLYDRRTAARAGAATLLAIVVALLITASTDEGGLAWTTRLGRVLPLAPVCAAIGTWLAMARAHARGELHAIEALGRSPWETAVRATAGAVAVVVVCAVALVGFRAIDVEGFFPAAPHGADYVHVAEGGFVDRATGMRIGERGEISSRSAGEVLVGRQEARAPRWGRLSAALSMVIAGIAFPMACARLSSKKATRWKSRRAVRTVASVGATLVASILLFQAAAAGRAPAFVTVIPPLALLLATTFRYREEGWQTKRG